MDPQSGSEYTLPVSGYIFAIKTFEICKISPVSIDVSKWFHGYNVRSMDTLVIPWIHSVFYAYVSINVSNYHDHVSTEPHILSPFLTTPVTSLETFRHRSGSLVIFKNLSNYKY